VAAPVAMPIEAESITAYITSVGSATLSRTTFTWNTADRWCALMRSVPVLAR